MAREARRMFVTSWGDELVAVRAGEMRKIDRIAVEETGPCLLQMMKNAGRSMAALGYCQLERHSVAKRVIHRTENRGIRALSFLAWRLNGQESAQVDGTLRRPLAQQYQEGGADAG